MTRTIPGTTQARLKGYLDARLPPSQSSVRPLHQEVTVCYAYMCPYAYSCAQKSARPARVLIRRCFRYMPEEMRPPQALSDLALDLMARRRRSGGRLSAEARTMLDELRPDGPLR